MGEDDVKMLEGSKYPLSKMSLIGFVGATGVGKTY